MFSLPLVFMFDILHKLRLQVVKVHVTASGIPVGLPGLSILPLLLHVRLGVQVVRDLLRLVGLTDSIDDLRDRLRADVRRVEVVLHLVDEVGVEIATEGEDGFEPAEEQWTLSIVGWAICRLS